MMLSAACTPSTVRVVGVTRQSSEMRPLPSVPLGGYQQLKVLVRAAANQSAERYGSPDCGYTMLEGTDEGQNLRNAACVPSEALNDTITIVRQRLRSYGINVVRDRSDAHDYDVEVFVTGEAPRKPNPALAQAVAGLTFTLQANPPPGTLIGSIDRNVAAQAFDAVSKNCGFRNANLSSFQASNTQPMTPDFDVVALAGGAVDNLLRCYDLANFFLVARQQFPKPGTSESTPALGAPSP